MVGEASIFSLGIECLGDSWRASGRHLGDGLGGWDIWEAAGRRLGDTREAAWAAVASGRQLAGVWEAAWAAGASWRPERRLGGKMCQIHCK